MLGLIYSGKVRPAGGLVGTAFLFGTAREDGELLGNVNTLERDCRHLTVLVTPG